MFLTLTSTAPQASDLGYLLHKHPDRAQQFSTAVGTATVFYPEATADRCTVALLLDVDPIGLVRKTKGSTGGFALGQYVNDRPYAASSMLAVALGRVFRTALRGTCDAKPELANQPLPLQITIPALPARQRRNSLAGPELVRAFFEPLGWAVTATSMPLSQTQPWGDAPYVRTELRGTMRLSTALSQLYVMLPVLDDSKHYWVSDDEVEKLIRHGAEWLVDHPLRDEITTRYLATRRGLVQDATARLRELDGDTTDDVVDETIERPGDQQVPLKQLRRDAVLRVLAEVGAKRVVDVGCGEGYYLQALLADPTFTQVVGVDVSAGELTRAETRLRLDRMPEQQRDRLTLRQSSVTYQDDALIGFDALLLVEVIEHVDEDRLPALVRNVFGAAKPSTVVVTTPNVEYNAKYNMSCGELRHTDHRFEWTRAEFRTWATAVADAHGYRVEFRGVGEDDPEVGTPTQLALFRKGASS